MRGPDVSERDRLIGRDWTRQREHKTAPDAKMPSPHVMDVSTPEGKPTGPGRLPRGIVSTARSRMAAQAPDTTTRSPGQREGKARAARAHVQPSAQSQGVLPGVTRTAHLGFGGQSTCTGKLAVQTPNLRPPIRCPLGSASVPSPTVPLNNTELGEAPLTPPFVGALSLAHFRPRPCWKLPLSSRHR